MSGKTELVSGVEAGGADESQRYIISKKAEQFTDEQLDTIISLLDQWLTERGM